jgi:hypothetical protein
LKLGIPEAFSYSGIDDVDEIDDIDGIDDDIDCNADDVDDCNNAVNPNLACSIILLLLHLPTMNILTFSSIKLLLNISNGEILGIDKDK